MTLALNVTDEMICNLLCSAFEGGSNYWYFIEKFIKPSSFRFLTDEGRVYRHIDYPLNPGGSLLIRTLEHDEIDGSTEWTLDLPAIKRGLSTMALNYPNHFADVIAENDDSTTADVFLQCCLFGKLVFG